MNQIRRAIREALEDEGVSQSELARRLNVNRSVVSRLVSPNYDGHSSATLRRVAWALGRELRVEFVPRDERSE